MYCSMGMRYLHVYSRVVDDGTDKLPTIQQFDLSPFLQLHRSASSFSFMMANALTLLLLAAIFVVVHPTPLTATTRFIQRPSFFKPANNCAESIFLTLFGKCGGEEASSQFGNLPQPNPPFAQSGELNLIRGGSGKNGRGANGYTRCSLTSPSPCNIHKHALNMLQHAPT